MHAYGKKYPGGLEKAIQKGHGLGKKAAKAEAEKFKKSAQQFKKRGK